MSGHPQYSCPLCSAPLSPGEQSLRCPAGHSFDQAKEGYVNLLPVQHKNSKIPGDSQEMVAARRAFLAAGHYLFLRDTLLSILAEQKPDVVIDCGCGEGYYTNAVGEQLEYSAVYGVDIAKAAVKYAAKRSAQVHFAVASSHRLPFSDDFADFLCKIFAPIDYDEATRVLKPDGLLLSVVPGPDHLIELKQRIYQTPKQHQAQTCPDGFVEVRSKRITREITLTDVKDIENLAQMTPFAWKLTPQTKQALLAQSELKMTFDFVLNLYRPVV